MQGNNERQYRGQWLVVKNNTGKNVTISLATPHKIKFTIFIPFWVDLHVGLYVLSTLVRNDYRYVLEATVRKNVKEENDNSDASLDKTQQQPVI